MVPRPTASDSPAQRSTSRTAGADAWRRRNGVLLSFCGGMMLVASLLLTARLPDAWDRECAPLRALVGSMLVVVPNIGKLAEVSSFKGVTELYLAITYTLVLATVVVLSAQRWPLDGRSRIPRKGRWVVLWLLAISLGGLGAGQIIGVRITPDMLTGYSLSAFVLRQISSSRAALAIYGTTMYVLESVLIAAAVVVSRNFKRLWLDDRFKHSNS